MYQHAKDLGITLITISHRQVTFCVGEYMMAKANEQTDVDQVSYSSLDDRWRCCWIMEPHYGGHCRRANGHRQGDPHVGVKAG
jgi:hypothetical protein